MCVGRGSLGLFKPLRRWLRSVCPAARMRKAGDAARGRRDWAAAARHYRAYLRRVPSDAGLWVQYGHAAKEDGAPDQAERAYRRALVLTSDQTDIRLHLAHLLKKQGRTEEAARMFLDMFAIDPSAGTLRELDRTGAAARAWPMLARRPAGVAADGIFVEVGDLLRYLSAHPTPTGIPRVTLALVDHVLHGMDGDVARCHRFVAHHGPGDAVVLLDKADMRRIADAASAAAPDPAGMRSLIDAAWSRSPVFRLAAGDTYLIVGAFWEFVADPCWIVAMRGRGVVVGVHFYDLIPITHPQYCVAEWAREFTLAFAETCRLASFALTISAYVAREVAADLARHGTAPFPIVPVPLAHEMRPPPDRAATVSAAGSTLLAGRAFVLCVSTIEARKNHAYLVEIWRRMIASGIAVPDLVFVGRRGWHVDDLFASLATSGHLGGRVHVFDGLSDETVDALYGRCLFTAFPSFVEGWGLPVGESLARGKVCVASSASSVPEVGGDFVVYVDPCDVDMGYETISGLVREPGRVAEIERRIAADFHARTWADVGRDFFAAVERLVAAQRVDGGRPIYAPSVASATMLDMAEVARAAESDPDYATNPQRLILASGWRIGEAAGAWTTGAAARLRLATDCAAGTAVTILLRLGTSHRVGSDAVLTVSAGAGDLHRTTLHADAAVAVTVDGRIDDAGVLAIDLSIAGASADPAAIRLAALGYVPAADRAGYARMQARAQVGH
jgi:glycosyltransferase involved in cell wall biosynthesis